MASVHHHTDDPRSVPAPASALRFLSRVTSAAVFTMLAPLTLGAAILIALAIALAIGVLL